MHSEKLSHFSSVHCFLHNSFSLGYALKVFERRLNPELDSWTTAVYAIVCAMTTVGIPGNLSPTTLPGRVTMAIASVFSIIFLALTVQAFSTHYAMKNKEEKVWNYVKTSTGNKQAKHLAATYIQAVWHSYKNHLMNQTATLKGNGFDSSVCYSMRTFRKHRKSMEHNDDQVQVFFREMISTRDRLEARTAAIEQRLEDMDYKIDAKMAEMNDLLQKNLKYLKHLTP